MVVNSYYHCHWSSTLQMRKLSLGETKACAHEIEIKSFNVLCAETEKWTIVVGLKE